MTEFFYTLCQTPAERHTQQSVLAAAYKQLCGLVAPSQAQRALRAVLQDYRITWRQHEAAVPA